MKHAVLVFAIALLPFDLAAVKARQLRPTSGGADAAFPLTVDSIMRGPDLVGYPPTNPRWSADSQKRYFEWRKPKEKGDQAHRRALFVDGGDIVMVDSAVAPKKSAARQITTTPTAEWRSFGWIDPKVITYKARDGVQVYARLFTPDLRTPRNGEVT